MGGISNNGRETLGGVEMSKWHDPEHHDPEETAMDRPRRKPPKLLVYFIALIALSAAAGELARHL